MTFFTANVPLERLQEVLSYDPETGTFTWLIRGRGIKPGRPAGYMSKDGRRYIRIDGVLVRASRAAWAIMTGEWPDFIVDHEDNDPSNDRWLNLRPATHPQNHANSRTYSSNKLGLKGVSLHAASGLYRARIGGKSEMIGYFKTPEEAHAAYVAAAKERYREFARAA